MLLISNWFRNFSSISTLLLWIQHLTLGLTRKFHSEIVSGNCFWMILTNPFRTRCSGKIRCQSYLVVATYLYIYIIRIGIFCICLCEQQQTGDFVELNNPIIIAVDSTRLTTTQSDIEYTIELVRNCANSQAELPFQNYTILNSFSSV